MKITRTGMLAKKIGMSQIFDLEGNLLPVTLLHVDQNVVYANKNIEKHGYDAVVVGFGKKVKSLKKPLQKEAEKKGVEAPKNIKEFRVSSEALLDVGKKISITHFLKGQKVDVTSTSIGKGFAGSMKRHNFGGLEASHGVSLTHRSHGSTGNRQDPGKVFKGKKMAGHMGYRKVTVQNLEIVDIDVENNIIAIHGSIPGAKGTLISIIDAIKLHLPPEVPFPAKIQEDNL